MKEDVFGNLRGMGNHGTLEHTGGSCQAVEKGFPLPLPLQLIKSPILLSF